MVTYKISPAASDDFEAFRDFVWAQSPLRWRFNGRPSASVTVEILMWLSRQLLDGVEASEIPWSDFEAKTRKGRPQNAIVVDQRPCRLGPRPGEVRKLEVVDPPDPCAKLLE